MTTLPPAEAAKLLEQAFTDVCDELGCAYDNEAPLIAIHDLKETNAKLRALLEWCQGKMGSVATDDELAERMVGL